VDLTAVFETWHIGDGNYPPLQMGMPSGYRSQRISILHPVSIGRELRVRQSQHAATALIAGAGVKGGHVFGVTDEKGERVIQVRVE